MISFTINKRKKTYKVTVNEDFSASIDNQPAHFDPTYNAVVLEDGYLIESEFIQGLRIEPKYVKKILEANNRYRENYDTYVDEQRTFTPEFVRLNCGKFVYSSPFSPVVVISETVENLNLFIEDDIELIKRITETLMDENGNIKVKDLLKMPEYKTHLKKLKEYEKIKEKQLEKERKFEDKTIGKIEVGLLECSSCNNIFIIGDKNRKNLPRLTFFNAKDELSSYNENSNKYAEFCYGLTDNFVYYLLGKAEECKLCKIE